MSIDQNWRDYQKSHAEAGAMAMGNLLDDGDKEDVLWSIAAIINLVEIALDNVNLPQKAVNDLEKAHEFLEAAHSLMGGGE